MDDVLKIDAGAYNFINAVLQENVHLRPNIKNMIRHFWFRDVMSDFQFMDCLHGLNITKRQHE